MSYMNTSCKEFIECAKDVYMNLIETEQKNIKYKDFVNRTVLKYYNGVCDDSSRKSGYRFFKIYYSSHPLNKDNPNRETKRLTIDLIKKLLDFDTKNEILTKNLKKPYNYYWYEQKVTLNGREGFKKYFLIIESNTTTIKELYKTIAKSYKGFFTSMYLGFHGLTIVFSKPDKLKEFLEILKK